MSWMSLSNWRLLANEAFSRGRVRGGGSVTIIRTERLRIGARGPVALGRGPFGLHCAQHVEGCAKSPHTSYATYMRLIAFRWKLSEPIKMPFKCGWPLTLLWFWWLFFSLCKVDVKKNSFSNNVSLVFVIYMSNNACMFCCGMLAGQDVNGTGDNCTGDDRKDENWWW